MDYLYKLEYPQQKLTESKLFVLQMNIHLDKEPLKRL